MEEFFHWRQVPHSEHNIRMEIAPAFAFTLIPVCEESRLEFGRQHAEAFRAAAGASFTSLHYHLYLTTFLVSVSLMCWSRLSKCSAIKRLTRNEGNFGRYGWASTEIVTGDSNLPITKY